MTIVAGFPKGIVDYVVSKKLIMRVILILLLVLVPLLYFIVCFSIWHKHGRNKPYKGLVVPQYESFEKLNPAESQAILNDGLNPQGLIATIIDLARRGFLEIKESEKSGILLKYSDFELIKKQSFADLEKLEHDILSDIFGRKKKVLLSDLKFKFASKMKSYKEMIGKSLVEKSFYKKRPSLVRMEWAAKFVIAAMIYFVFTIILIPLTGDPFSVLLQISAVVMIFIGGIFAYFMPATTRHGSMAFEHTLGLKEYLHTAERFRLKDVKAEHFNKLLPFAVAFGVADQWAKRFKDILKESPNWYSSSHAFTTKSFTNSLNSFNNNFSKAFTTQSSASSSSGFSGGSIGGGGGGGGISAG